jgi:Cu2+-exporting ATPase
LAAAVAREASERQPFTGAVEEPGRGVRTTIDGVEARLGSLDYCGIDRALPGTSGGASVIAVRHGVRTAVLEVAQVLRADARDVVDALRACGLEIRILSGDRVSAVAPVARALGIEHWQAELSPGRKVAALQALKSQGRRVLMVGDGINDAPALAEAHVSLSPISAAELTQAQADAVFLGARLAPVLDALTTSRKARALMRQNLILAVIYNVFAIPIAVAGLVTPLIAALAMSGSSMLVTTNALRVSTRRQALEVGSGSAAAAMQMQPVGP